MSESNVLSNELFLGKVRREHEKIALQEACLAKMLKFIEGWRCRAVIHV